MFEVGQGLTTARVAHSAPALLLRRVLDRILPETDTEDAPAEPGALSRREIARRRRRDFERARRERMARALTLPSLSWKRAALAVSVVTLLFAAGAAWRSGSHVRRWAAEKLPSAELAAAALGLGLDQISLEGHEFTFDGDVFDALDLQNAKTFAAFDAKAAKERIERLPWVATAELTRVYPNRLDIRITERTPYAVWARGSKNFLVDVTGRVLAPVPAGTTPELPRIKGEGAAEAAKAFLDLVDRYPALRTRFDEAERVGERRWTLRLKGNVEILLPAQAEERALSDVMGDQKLTAIAAGENVSIDTRVQGRVAINKTKDPRTIPPGT